MTKIGFDNETYLQLQSKKILERVDRFGGKLYLEFGGISDDDYSEYMEVLNQEGFSVIENVSEEIEEGNYVSIGTLLSNEDKWLSISYIPDSLTIYISFDNN